MNLLRFGAPAASEECSSSTGALFDLAGDRATY
jgi:hypothetical protein